MASKIRVAVVGVGNCCSALVQGIRFNSQNNFKGIHAEIGGYKLRDIDVVAAFDVDERKVGVDLSEAIFREPNNYAKVYPVTPMNIPVLMGPILDGVDGALRDTVQVAGSEPVDVAAALKESKVDTAICLLPAGADEASKFYAEAALRAGCGFINASTTPIANNSAYAESFKQARLPLVGDDVMSQIGGTIFHKNILEFLARRGVHVSNSYQLDVSGGLETFNTIQPEKRALKRNIKTSSIKDALPYEAEIVAGTTDYVDFLENSRVSYFWIKGEYFLGTPVEVDIYLKSVDAPNSSLILLDSIRATKLALDRKVGGPLISVCAYGYKSPPVKASTIEAERWFQEFIDGNRER